MSRGLNFGLFGLFALVFLFLFGAYALTGCGSADRAAAARAQAEASAIRARSSAATERAIQERESSRQSHQQFLEIVPILLMVGGGVLVVLLGGFIFWDIRTRTVMQYDAEIRRLELQRLQGYGYFMPRTQENLFTITQERSQEVMIYDDR